LRETSRVATGTALYLFDSARLDLLKAKIFGIYGTLRSVAPTTSPVEIAAHAASGSLVDGEGFSLYFYSGCSSYSAADGSGTVLQNATLSNLAANTAMVIECSPRIYNVKATANSSIGVGYLYVGISASTPMIENSRFEKMTLSIASPGVPARTQAFGGGFAIKKNVFSNGFYALYLASFNASSTGFASGQIEGNQFDTVGGTKNVYRFSVAGAADIPLSGNYWSGGTGTPSVPGTSSAGTNGSGSLVFATALSAAPSDVGPTW
jgi:hypothetical protein